MALKPLLNRSICHESPSDLTAPTRSLTSGCPRTEGWRPKSKPGLAKETIPLFSELRLYHSICRIQLTALNLEQFTPGAQPVKPLDGYLRHLWHVIQKPCHHLSVRKCWQRGFRSSPRNSSWFHMTFPITLCIESKNQKASAQRRLWGPLNLLIPQTCSQMRN